MAWGDYLSRPNIPDPMGGLNMMNQGIQTATGSLNELGGIVKKRATANAVKQLFDATKEIDAQDPYAYQQGLMSKANELFQGDATLDPVTQLGLVNTLAKPVFDKRAWDTQRADRAFDESIATSKLGLQSDKLQEDKRHNKVIDERQNYAIVSDKAGNTYKYNKYTGEYELINKAPVVTTTTGSGNVVDNKNVVLKEETYKDGSGNIVKKLTPVNKLTGHKVIRDKDGNLVDSGEPLTTAERPKITQADKDTAVSNKAAMANVKAIDKLYAPDIVGPVDNTLAWVANTTGTAQKGGDAERNYKLNQEIQNLKANLTSALIKGVPSDRDLKMINDMLPSTSDSEAVFKGKLARIKQILERQNKIQQDTAIKQGQGDYYEQEVKKSKSGRPYVTVNGNNYYLDKKAK